MKDFGILFIFLLSLFSFRCSNFNDLNFPTFNTAEEIQRFYIDQTNHIFIFNGSGKITFESPEYTQDGHFTVKIIQPDTFSIKLSGYFGIPLGLLIINGNNYVLVNNIEHTVRKGLIDSLDTFINLPLSANDIIKIFIGSYIYSIIDYSNTRIDKKGKNISLENQNNIENKKLLVSFEQPYFTKFVHYENKKLKLEISAHTYKIIDGIFVPYWTTIKFHETQQSLTIAYDDIKINNKVDIKSNH